MIKSAIAHTVKKVAPTYYKRRSWKRRWSEMRSCYDEQELYIAPLLCDQKKTSIDIGASEGIYTAHIIGSSRDCLAFEPLEAKARELAEMANSLSLPVRVEAVALSDARGEATLRILKEDEWRSTIERENPLENAAIYEIKVPTRRLDEYDLDAVGFIKIDVEGHELSIVKGASNTIEQHRPSMIIEIEDRHKPNAIRDVGTFLTTFGYEGYFLLDRALTPISRFDFQAHQNTDNISGWGANSRKWGLYVNNFLFIPAEDLSRLEAAVAKVRSNLSDFFRYTEASHYLA
jgi:FkbM family methyltransferase